MRYKECAWLVFIIFIQACQQGNTQQGGSEILNAEIEIDSKQFKEIHRPQLHFTPPAQWMNDPNGMVYYEGEYHLFYQHYPDSTVWGPMHWGHAVSSDMVHWQHLPIALYPDDLGYIFSGSAVIDWDNTSGFGSAENPPMVAIFTYHNMEGERAGKNHYQTQGIAYSLDKGRTWSKFQENPIIKNPGIRDFRDPKVTWSDDYKKWILVLAAKDHVAFYTSVDLKNWKYESDFGANIGAHGGVWECPDLFKLKDSSSNLEKWVLLSSINPGGPNGGSATQYFIGEFNGKSFVPDTEETRWLDYGKDNYAGVSWSNVPKQDGRRLFMGWMSNWQYANVVPTSTWRSAMTIPREICLVSNGKQYELSSMPVSELSTLKKESELVFSGVIEGEKEILIDQKLSNSILDVEVSLNESSKIVFSLGNELGEAIKIGFDRNGNEFFVDRLNSGKEGFSDQFEGIHLAPRLINSNKLKFQLVIDVSSIEFFADEGKTVMTEVFFPTTNYDRLSIYSEGSVSVGNLTVTTMNSIW